MIATALPTRWTSRQPRDLTHAPSGTTRSRNAMPCLVLDHAIAEDTCAACGAQFESWTAGAARRADADGLGETARRTRARRAGPIGPSTLMPSGTALTAQQVRRRTLAGRCLA